MSNPWDARNYYAFMKIDLGIGQTYEFNKDRTFIGQVSPIQPKGIETNPTVFPGA